MSKPRLESLTSLRFFAAAAVVLYHWNPATFSVLPWWIRNLTTNGYHAVGFFFVLSGFVLTYSYYAPAEQNTLRCSDRLFWIARFARIYPVYLLALVLCTPVLVYSVFVVDTTSTAAFVGALLFVPSLLQAWVPPLAMAWNPPAWSLSVEALFYAAFPWLARKSRDRSPQVILSFSLAAVIIVAAIRVVVRDAPHAWLPSSALAWQNFWDFWPLLHLPSFIFGMALGRVFLSPRHIAPGLWSILFVSSVGLLFVVLMLKTRLPTICTTNVVLVPLYGVLILSSVESQGFLTGVLSHRSLVVLGESSYGIYILHNLIRIWFLKIVSWAGLEPTGWFAHGAYWLVLLAACVGTFFYLETPARRYLSRTLASRVEAPVTVLKDPVTQRT